MPPPNKPRNQPPRRQGPPGGPRGKKPKKKGSALSGQIVGGATIAVLLGIGAVVLFMAAPHLMPKPKATATPDAAQLVSRPTLDQDKALDSEEPKRPGLKLTAPDEIYLPKCHDLKPTSPLEEPVDTLLAKGIITVFSDGKFRPNDPLPRAEFLAWCHNAVMAQTEQGPDPFMPAKKHLPVVEPMGDEFKDLPAEHWAAPAVVSFKKTGFFDGVLDKAFRPDAPLTREEWAGFAAILAVKAEDRAKLPEQIDKTKLAVALRGLNYTDAPAVKDEYQPGVFLIASDVKRKGWIIDTFGPPELPGPWGPSKAVTRGEAAKWLAANYDAVGVGLVPN